MEEIASLMFRVTLNLTRLESRSELYKNATDKLREMHS